MHICDRWVQEGATDQGVRSHLPQCTTPRADRQIASIEVTNRSVTSRTVAQHIQSLSHHPLSVRTIRHLLQQSGLCASRPLLCQPCHRTTDVSAAKRTNLAKAAWSLNSIIVHTLIEAGADVNLRNENGETPLIIAADTCVEYILEDEFDNKYLWTLELLLKNAGDIDSEIFLRNSTVENNIIICRPIIQVMIKFFILQHPTENKPEDIPLPKDLSDWWKDCQSQVKLMQSQILGKSDISLYRILTETDQHKVMGFLSNDATGLQQAIERNLPFYNETFPIYAEVIKERFNISVKSAISLCECFSMAMKFDFTKSNKFLMLKILKQLHCWNWEHYLHTDIVKEWPRD
ncbi:GDE1 [Cordylochernes scorpioides]|uniref:GDE1 n=1 Tax=Cordylochernes scorpioides TaxID=51811 RepID=A0ABY6KZG2_9ARAC|nr:GDE1 [Cordylochernes scorpioides]